MKYVAPPNRLRRTVAAVVLAAPTLRPEPSRTATEVDPNGTDLPCATSRHPEELRDVRLRMDGLDALSSANAGFERRLRLVHRDDWERPTPCEEWDVRALVNHVVGANRRYALLLKGASAMEVDATRRVDHLGDDPVASFLATSAELTDAFRDEGALARTVHHPAGYRTGAELLGIRVLDVAVHCWDLARAIEADDTLDPDVVEFVLTLPPGFEASRQQGAFAAPVGEIAIGSSPQDRLLHLLGRSQPEQKETQ